MKYNAIIEYTGNVERAGKLTLTSEDGRTLLSKVPVAMPDEIFNVPQLFERIYSTRAVQVKMDDDLKKFDKSGNYEKAYSEVTRGNSDGYFIKSAGQVIIKPTTDAKMKNDDHAFVMHSQHFEVLFDILAKKEQLELSTNKVAFLWFPEKVINATGGINITLSNFDSVETTVRNQKDDGDRIKALEAAQKKAKVNVGSAKPKLSDAVKNIANIVEQEAKNTVKPTVTKPVKPQTVQVEPQGRQSVIQAVPTRTTTYSDDVDALDIVLMYSNPELAPFIKPNSSLAWYLYFSNRDNVDKTYVEENIQNVQGFENVGSSDFKYTPKGYSVTLFEDENKNNPVGRIEFDSQKQCYEVVSNTGEKTLLSVGENGQLSSCFKSSNGNETKMDLIQTDKGFIGNWESDNNGVKVNSSISIDNDFGYSSSPNESIDLSSVVAATVATEVANNYTSKVEQNFDFDYKSEPSVEKEYTPPPPPPPKNDEVWGSSDPYSNGASFRM